MNPVFMSLLQVAYAKAARASTARTRPPTPPRSSSAASRRSPRTPLPLTCASDLPLEQHFSHPCIRSRFCKTSMRCAIHSSTSKSVTRTLLQTSDEKGCKCVKSQCIRKYCECFAAGRKCTSPCTCVGCCNPHGVRKSHRPSGDFVIAAEGKSEEDKSEEDQEVPAAEETPKAKPTRARPQLRSKTLISTSDTVIATSRKQSGSLGTPRSPEYRPSKNTRLPTSPPAAATRSEQAAEQRGADVAFSPQAPQLEDDRAPQPQAGKAPLHPRLGDLQQAARSRQQRGANSPRKQQQLGAREQDKPAAPPQTNLDSLLAAVDILEGDGGGGGNAPAHGDDADAAYAELPGSGGGCGGGGYPPDPRYAGYAPRLGLRTGSQLVYADEEHARAAYDGAYAAQLVRYHDLMRPDWDCLIPEDNVLSHHRKHAMRALAPHDARLRAPPPQRMQRAYPPAYDDPRAAAAYASRYAPPPRYYDPRYDDPRYEGAYAAARGQRGYMGQPEDATPAAYHPHGRAPPATHYPDDVAPHGVPPTSSSRLGGAASLAPRPGFAPRRTLPVKRKAPAPADWQEAYYASERQQALLRGAHPADIYQPERECRGEDQERYEPSPRRGRSDGPYQRSPRPDDCRSGDMRSSGDLRDADAPPQSGQWGTHAGYPDSHHQPFRSSSTQIVVSPPRYGVQQDARGGAPPPFREREHEHDGPQHGRWGEQGQQRYSVQREAAHSPSAMRELDDRTPAPPQESPQRSQAMLPPAQRQAPQSTAEGARNGGVDAAGKAGEPRPVSEDSTSSAARGEATQFDGNVQNADALTRSEGAVARGAPSLLQPGAHNSAADGDAVSDSPPKVRGASDVRCAIWLSSSTAVTDA